ncbi:hypothetical protein F4775DRAFT_604612 [Biscogniauxia sp. FL1348]|nr:hypothetical protein F4775DRAFT_604612 [Biscogniauxia sp. FL1348]
MPPAIVRSSRVAFTEDPTFQIWNQYRPTAGNTPDPQTRQIVETNCGDPVLALNYAQNGTREDVHPLVLAWALFWERHSMSNQDMVATPNVSFLSRFFSDDPMISDVAREEIQINFLPDRAIMQPIYEPIRSREWTLLIFHRLSIYIPVLVRIQPLAAPVIGYNGDGTVARFFDRRVTDMLICDAYAAGELTAAQQATQRGQRRAAIYEQVAEFLFHGCVQFERGAVNRAVMLGLLPEATAYNTGAVAYGISVELLRRLRGLAWDRRYAGPAYVEDRAAAVFGPFNQEYTYQRWLAQMRGAVASRAVELSEHRTRIAVEVPAADAGHNHQALNPALTYHGLMAPTLPDDRHVQATDAVPVIYATINAPGAGGPFMDLGDSDDGNGGDGGDGGGDGGDGGSSSDGDIDDDDDDIGDLPGPPSPGAGGFGGSGSSGSSGSSGGSGGSGGGGGGSGPKNSGDTPMEDASDSDSVEIIPNPAGPSDSVYPLTPGSEIFPAPTPSVPNSALKGRKPARGGASTLGKAKFALACPKANAPSTPSPLIFPASEPATRGGANKRKRGGHDGIFDNGRPAKRPTPLGGVKGYPLF